MRHQIRRTPRIELIGGVRGLSTLTKVTTYVASDGVRLHVEIDGPASGPTAVLVHGLAGSIALQWRATGVIPALASDGVRVVAFDLPSRPELD